MNALFLERRDLAPISAIRNTDLRIGIDLAHEPDAARAQDAAVAIQHQGWAEIDVGADAFTIEDAPWKFHSALVRPEAVREILERALAALVAHRTVERMID